VFRLSVVFSISLLVAALAVQAWATAAPEPAAAGGAVTSETEAKGLKLDFSVAPVAQTAAARPLREGELAEFQVRISDASSGAPISSLQPAVWISNEAGMDAQASCRDTTSAYLQGMLGRQADVDLNKYFILIMNNDQTISVVDPLLGVNGITQLYGMVFMKDRGEDWVVSADGRRMFVTMPREESVAVVDLQSFRVLENVAVGSNPVRAVLQPDGRYLWVGNDTRARDGTSGVTVIDTQSLEVVAHIPTGAGHHELAFSDDSLTAFVTNSVGNTVSVVDTQTLSLRRDLPTGRGPVAVQFSSLGQSVYVGAEDGEITVLDGGGEAVTGSLQTGAGLIALRFAPGGRWGFVANVKEDRVTVLDASRADIARTLPVGDQPHQFAFTTTYAYVRHLGTSSVTLIPLNQLAGSGNLAIKEVPLGDRAPGEYAFGALADSISPTGEWTAVVAANPSDAMVYYYMEGMIAPMGSYQTYGRIPRAVRVVDRSVRETGKGVYSARFRVPAPGRFKVSVLMDAPVVNHCFSFEAEADPALAAAKQAKDTVGVSYQRDGGPLVAGEPYTLRFRLSGSVSKAPISGLKDVVVLTTRAPYTWQDRKRARPLEDGRYEVSLVPDQAGVFLVSVAAPSAGLDFTDQPNLSLRAKAPAASAEGGARP